MRFTAGTTDDFRYVDHYEGIFTSYLLVLCETAPTYFPKLYIINHKELENVDLNRTGDIELMTKIYLIKTFF